MKPFAFVIAPIRADPEFDSKMAIVKSACETLGLECNLPRPSPHAFGLEAAMTAIRGAETIIADLSFARPSCYYELGLVEAAGRQASLIACTGSEIFQHSGRGEVAFYDDLAGYERAVAGALRAGS